MSFSVSFNARRDEAASRLETEQAPDSVKDFVRKSLEHMSSPNVAVVAYGHICDGPESYKVSNCTVTVTPLDAEGNPSI